MVCSKKARLMSMFQRANRNGKKQITPALRRFSSAKKLR
jgi:hypothetical protein